MATTKEEELPLVLVHRPPNFHFPFKDRLQTHFRLLDPLDSDPPESTHAFFSRHAFSIRVLLCVDPTPIPRDLLSLLPSLQLIVCSSPALESITLTCKMPSLEHRCHQCREGLFLRRGWLGCRPPYRCSTKSLRRWPVRSGWVVGSEWGIPAWVQGLVFYSLLVKDYIFFLKKKKIVSYDWLVGLSVYVPIGWLSL